MRLPSVLHVRALSALLAPLEVRRSFLSWSMGCLEWSVIVRRPRHTRRHEAPVTVPDPLTEGCSLRCMFWRLVAQLNHVAAGVGAVIVQELSGIVEALPKLCQYGIRTSRLYRSMPHSSCFVPSPEFSLSTSPLVLRCFI